MDDIWASYYVESLGFKVIYGPPSVFQERNEHNLINDMKKEYLGYENNLNLLMDIKTQSSNINNYLPSKSAEAFKLYKSFFN